MTNADAGGVVLYDGASAAVVAALLGVPRIELLGTVTSTQDVAHELASADAPAGTLVLAHEQTSGRGRHGRAWTSNPGAGVWLTLIERPSDPASADVLSLRVGLGLARALERFTTDPVRLKWPNDVYIGDRKLAGVLAEARWRDGAIEWVAVGVGINVVAPSAEPRAIGLAAGTTRLDVLRAVVPQLRDAAAALGHLTDSELAEFAARDYAAGHGCVEPVAGRVAGIDRTGALLINTGSRVAAVRAGSLVLQEEAT
ncbi:MAG TPA: biotin--[acetyl-CoA-carboxylase] ligase [Gemmatimonadaceae bacterium]|jgi:BirA family biotin operon repressor/biotin-[acetyl-CoA-carboxylase] ligase|nr:biotin--[acetyl-CoA-carboxylase] ligase [Gemmatimonadaceae bacterium]